MKNKVPLLSALTLAMMLSSQPLLAKDMTNNNYWWPEQLDLSPLRAHSAESNPYGQNFDYAKEFNSLDLAAVKADIKTILTTPQD